jgi:hypothetical protein
VTITRAGTPLGEYAPKQAHEIRTHKKISHKRYIETQAIDGLLQSTVTGQSTTYYKMDISSTTVTTEQVDNTVTVCVCVCVCFACVK